MPVAVAGGRGTGHAARAALRVCGIRRTGVRDAGAGRASFFGEAGAGPSPVRPVRVGEAGVGPFRVRPVRIREGRGRDCRAGPAGIVGQAGVCLLYTSLM
ncbi:hypothetical protein, partial [Streptomyces sp. f51]|uniref:hypothetical protein n=1 Tax=Streptomyces sp. f51 TaxID=1827742 RepID=UPI001C54D10C